MRHSLFHTENILDPVPDFPDSRSVNLVPRSRSCLQRSTPRELSTPFNHTLTVTEGGTSVGFWTILAEVPVLTPYVTNQRVTF